MYNNSATCARGLCAADFNDTGCFRQIRSWYLRVKNRCCTVCKWFLKLLLQLKIWYKNLFWGVNLLWVIWNGLKIYFSHFNWLESIWSECLLKLKWISTKVLNYVELWWTLTWEFVLLINISIIKLSGNCWHLQQQSRCRVLLAYSVPVW